MKVGQGHIQLEVQKSRSVSQGLKKWHHLIMEAKMFVIYYVASSMVLLGYR